MKRSMLGIVGAVAAVAIIVASVLTRLGGPADPAADVALQRADVTRFHALVRAGRWHDVFRATTEPPTRDPDDFVELMHEQVDAHGKVTGIEIDGLRLLRSRTTPLLEVREIVTISDGGRASTRRTVSYFARRGQRWLFAFSAPDDES